MHELFFSTGFSTFGDGFAKKGDLSDRSRGALCAEGGPCEVGEDLPYEADPVLEATYHDLDPVVAALLAAVGEAESADPGCTGLFDARSEAAAKIRAAKAALAQAGGQRALHVLFSEENALRAKAAGKKKRLIGASSALTAALQGDLRILHAKLGTLRKEIVSAKAAQSSVRQARNDIKGAHAFLTVANGTWDSDPRVNADAGVEATVRAVRAIEAQIGTAKKSGQKVAHATWDALSLAKTERDAAFSDQRHAYVQCYLAQMPTNSTAQQKALDKVLNESYAQYA